MRKNESLYQLGQLKPCTAAKPAFLCSKTSAHVVFQNSIRCSVIQTLGNPLAMSVPATGIERASYREVDGPVAAISFGSVSGVGGAVQPDFSNKLMPK